MVSRCLASIALLCPLIVFASAEGLLEPPVCGVSVARGVYSDRIIGGIAAKKDAWPWMGALGYKNPDGTATPVFKCGATLITNKHVLTSAYCASGIDNLILVRFSSLTLDGERPVDVNIEEKQVHSEYNEKTKANDIAVLTLKKEVIFSDSLRPICLPHKESLVNDDFGGKFAYIAGWGSTSYQGPPSNFLKQSMVPVIVNEKCRESYSGFPSLAITNRTICAGKVAGGTNACIGDNGGPLMMLFDGNVYEIGLYIHSYKCAERGYPGIFTRITEYLDFIKQAIEM